MMEESTEPSMCMVAPMGNTILLISSGTPIFRQASMLAGIAATELWVAKAVSAGLRMCFSMRFTAVIPPAKYV